MNTTKLHPIIQGLSSPIIMSFENINFCVGLPLNIYVIILLTRAGGLDGSLVFTLNQVAVEILFALQAPLFILCYVNFESFCFYSPIIYITGTCMASRFLFQCCVCFERYLAVVHPLTFIKYKATQYRLAVSGIMWINSFIGGTLFFEMLTNLLHSIFVILYIITLSMILVFSFSLLRSLRRPGPGARERDGSGISSAKKKALKIVSGNFLIFLIQTIAETVCFVMSCTSSEDAFALAFFIAINIVITVGLVKPFLFLYQNGKLTCMR